jgi:hypothetical protein
MIDNKQYIQYIALTVSGQPAPELVALALP